MRLYLSSYKLGDNPEELFNLAGKNKHVGIIFNAGDFDTQEERLIRLEKNIKNLKLLGFTAEEIDLRKYFGKTDLLEIFFFLNEPLNKVALIKSYMKCLIRI